MNERNKPIIVCSALLPKPEQAKAGLVLMQPWMAELAERAGHERASFRFMPSPWKNIAEYRANLAMLEDTHAYFAPLLAERLNSLHGTDHPLGFWEVLFGSWLNTLLHITWDRLARLNAVRERFGQDALLAAVPRELKPRDGFADLVNEYCEQENTVSAFYAVLASKLGLELLKLPPDPNLSSKRYLPGLAGGANAKPPKHCSLEYPGGNVLTYDLDWPFEREKAIAELKLTLFKPGETELEAIPCDRTLLQGIPGRNAFENLVAELLPVLAQPVVLEKFAALIAEAKPFAGYKAYFSCYYWHHSSPVFRAAAALGRLSGAKLVSWQHGGSFGHYERVASEWLERRICDVYITRGWKDDLDLPAKLMPLPQKQIEHLQNTACVSDPRVLWASSSITRHTYRLMLYPHDCSFVPQYLNERQRFADTLSSQVRASLVYRPYVWDYGFFEYEQAIFANYPEVTLDCREQILELLQKAKLFVCDHLGTAMLYAMTINTPCVFFWNREGTPERSSATAVFDALRQAGVLHHDPETAAAKVNAIWPDPQAWWAGAGIQEARRLFLEKYCLTKPGCLNIWRQALGDCFGLNS